MHRSRSPRRRQPFITPTRAGTVGTVPKGGTKVCPGRTNPVPPASEAASGSIRHSPQKPEGWTVKINKVLEQQESIAEVSQKLQVSASLQDRDKETMRKRYFAHDQRIEALEAKFSQRASSRGSSTGRFREAQSTSSSPAVIPPPLRRGAALHPGPSPHLDSTPVRPGPPPPLECNDGKAWHKWYKAEKSWTECQSWYGADGYCRLCKNDTGGAVYINLLHLIQEPHRSNVNNFYPGKELHEVL